MSATRPLRRHRIYTAGVLWVASSLISCSPRLSTVRSATDLPPFLYVWAGSADTNRRAAFLSTFDLRGDSRTRGQVMEVVSAGSGGRGAHHTEHLLGADGVLFANDFGAGRTSRFDLGTPGLPHLLGNFSNAGPFAFPHSFVRLPNANLLATYQTQATGHPPGGIAELRPDGTPVRWASAATSSADPKEIQPYSLEILPGLDRVVSTSTGMIEDVGVHIHIWRLSDLSLLHELRVPEAPPHEGHESHPPAHHLFPGEPRILADGHTVMLATFTCGLYVLRDVASTLPRLEFVYAFPGRDCAVPVVVGHYWIQTVPKLRALVALDVSDPLHPRETSRLVLGEHASPHWLARDASGHHLIADSGSETDSHLYMVTFDSLTGALGRDRGLPVLDLGSVSVPGVGKVVGVPHGAVFSH